ncbi:MAG: MFS transporter [Pseudomonadota bacterium]|nr:MFS transporter [Pseudomonadota bacterium]
MNIPDGTARCEPSRLYRWTVLVFVSLTMGANYYMYDSINPLERIFIERLGFSATTFGWLNSAYAVTAILTLLIGGILIDRIGTKRAITFFAIICCLGAALTAVSGRPGMMICGRALLGLGGESLVVAATTVIAKWFKGKELSFAFGIKITIARLASVASDNSPTWANKVFYPQGPAGEPSWQGPLLLAVGAGLIAVMCSGVYWALESRAEGRYGSTLPVARATQKMELGQTLRFNPSYWYVVGICLTFYSAIFPFRTFAIDFFTNKILAAGSGLSASEAMYVLAHKQAGMFASLLPLSAMVATPLLGLLSDKIGKRASLMMFASLMLMPVYLLMGYTNVSLFVPLCMMGVAFSVIPAVMWPSVAYIVDPRRLGTAYALMTLIEQLGFFALNLLIGHANDHQHAGPGNPEGYRLGLLIFSTLGLAGFVFTLLLRIREKGPDSHGLETITARSA